MEKNKNAVNYVHNAAKAAGFDEAVFVGSDEEGQVSAFFEGSGKGIVELIVDLIVAFHEQTNIPMEDLLSDIHYDAAYANSMREREKTSIFDI